AHQRGDERRGGRTVWRDGLRLLLVRASRPPLVVRRASLDVPATADPRGERGRGREPGGGKPISAMKFRRAKALVVMTLANVLAVGPADAMAQATSEAQRDRFGGASVR